MAQSSKVLALQAGRTELEPQHSSMLTILALGRQRRKYSEIPGKPGYPYLGNSASETPCLNKQGMGVYGGSLQQGRHGEVPQQVKGLPCKCENQSSEPEHPHKHQASMTISPVLKTQRQGIKQTS